MIQLKATYALEDNIGMAPEITLDYANNHDPRLLAELKDVLLELGYMLEVVELNSGNYAND